jgi:hypothetical protein
LLASCANEASWVAKSADSGARPTRKALEMRKAGATYAEIATQLGFADRSAARKSVHSAIDDVTREPAREVITLELERLDTLLLGVWTRARNGDVQAIDRALRIMERRSAYLGIDAPKKTAADLDATVVVDRGTRDERFGVWGYSASGMAEMARPTVDRGTPSAAAIARTV